MKIIIEEYGAIVTGFIIGIAVVGMIGTILYSALSDSINFFSTILYG